MIVMLDNYDSFTYNLVQYLGELGARVQVFRNDEVPVQEIENLSPSHIVISPGPCTPNEAGITLELIARMAGRVPILGVCLGHQAIGQAFGGKLGARQTGDAWQGVAHPARRQRGLFSSPERIHCDALPLARRGAAIAAGCLAVSAESETARSWGCAIAICRSKACSSTRKRC